MTILLDPQRTRQTDHARRKCPEFWFYEDKRGLTVISGNAVSSQQQPTGCLIPVKAIRDYLDRLDA